MVSACDRNAPTTLKEVRRIGLDAPTVELRPGQTIRLTATPLNASDHPVNVPVTWRSLTPALLTVDDQGQITALAPGDGIVRASVGTVFADVTVHLVNPPVASVALGPDTVTLLLPNGTLALTADIRDADGLAIIGSPRTWSSSADRIATVSSTGQVTPLAAGSAVVRVVVEAVSDSVVVNVGVEANPLAPLITSVTPAQVVPGVPVVIQGLRFGTNPAANTLRVDGVPMTVTAASATQLTAVLPAGVSPCLPTRTVALQAATAAGIGVSDVTLQVASRTTLAPGDAFVVTTAAAGACQELVFGDGEFLMTVTHAGTALGGGNAGAVLRGRVAPGVVTGPSMSGTHAAGVAEPASAAPTPDALAHEAAAARVARARTHAHDALLRASVEQLRSARPKTLSDAGRDPALQLPPVDGIVTVRIPDLDSPTFCANFSAVGVRTVFSGTRVVILEDTTSMRAGTPTLARGMDAMITELGQEIEAAIWPILTRFGDPLVMDSRLDANGRVAIILTPKLNAMRGGNVLGAVLSCDFFPRAQLPSSNVGEVLYLQVPTTMDAGFAIGTRDRWRWEIRSVVAHELKHVVSFAERIVRGQPLEELWLEEALARHAEELYARTLYSAPQRGDAQYAGTLRCEAREAGLPAGCGDTPRVMRAHFEALYDFLAAPAAHSPLGGTSASDVSFYGSAWALTRWAIDQSTQSETAILSALTTSGQSGVTNLEGRLGIPWDAMLSLWSLAMLSDGSLAVPPSSPQLAFPTWDLSEIFASLCADVGSCASGGPPTARFGRSHPALPIARGTGTFDLTFSEIAPGGFAAVRLSGTVSNAAQLLELRGIAGPLPPTLRLSILRVR